MRRAISVAAIGMLAAFGLTLTTAAPAGAADFSATEATFVDKINILRTSEGLGTLTVDVDLTVIARRWAGAMADADQISHNAKFQSEVNTNWLKIGENVGRGGDVNRLMAAFIASPAHFKNLVDPRFTLIGVGVVVSDGTIFTSHQFMRLKDGRGKPAEPGSVATKAASRTAPSAPPRVLGNVATVRTKPLRVVWSLRLLTGMTPSR